jgi:hypothetical protein
MMFESMGYKQTQTSQPKTHQLEYKGWMVDTTNVIFSSMRTNAQTTTFLSRGICINGTQTKQ